MSKKLPGQAIAVGNQKGGVGKTTNSVNIAAGIGARGYKTLIIDLDPGAGATKHLGINPKSYAGTFELIVSQDHPSELAIVDGMPPNVHLIPARPELAEVDKHLSKFDNPTRLFDKGLELARKDYDFIILDTCPYANAPTTVSAYSAADWFLLSAFPHHLSVEGLNEALADIADARAKQNPKLEILGLIFCCVDRRTKARQETEQFIKKYMPERAFSVPYIPTNVVLNKAAEKGKSLLNHKAFAKHEITEAYRIIAGEIIERCHNRDAFLAGKLSKVGDDFDTPKVANA